MKKVLAVVLAAAFVCVGAYSADAQVPLLKVVFDGDFGKDSKDCPGLAVQDTISLILSNFNNYLGAIEFGVNYPPSMSFATGADLFIPNEVVHSGDTSIDPTDMTIAYGNTPVNAFVTAVVHRVQFFWNCIDCSGSPDQLIQVIPNSVTGLLQGATWPNNVLIPVAGGLSVVCPTAVPTEKQTWGQIKSLYGE